MPEETASNETAPRGEEKLFFGIVVALAVIAGIGSWLAVVAFSHKEKVRGMEPDHSRWLKDFSFTDSTGQTVSRHDVDGKVLAVSFLFTSCSLTCREVSHSMSQIQQLTTNEPGVRLLSFTVDPRSDTVPVLAKWGARYGADTNRWYLLTGDQAQLHDVIGTSFLATETNNPFNSMPGNFGGTERIALVDKQGRVRMFFDGLRVETPAAVAAEIELLRKEH
ncbi:MAG TPA: SCO family protein [Verrucomicrobiae bacterium]|nr:SCO family protein [Verrucomicrobiae bacterium]